MKKKFVRHEVQKSNSGGLILYGRHAVMSALENPERKIHKLVCTAENASEIRAKYANLHLVVADRKDIDKLVPPEAVHQGYALFCNPLDNLSIEELCINTEDDVKCNVLILDQVTDPQNIGAIIRSCECAGVDGIIIPKNRAVQVNETVVRTSKRFYGKSCCRHNGTCSGCQSNQFGTCNRNFKETQFLDCWYGWLC